MQFAVGAWTGDGAGISDALAGPEAGDLGAYRLDYADRVPAQHPCLAEHGHSALAHLGIDRID